MKLCNDINVRHTPYFLVPMLLIFRIKKEIIVVSRFRCTFRTNPWVGRLCVSLLINYNHLSHTQIISKRHYGLEFSTILNVNDVMEAERKAIFHATCGAQVYLQALT